MTHAVSRSLVDRFCKAYAVRDADKIAEFFDDNIEWTISGPVEYLHFCGVHRGKDNGRSDPPPYPRGDPHVQLRSGIHSDRRRSVGDVAPPVVASRAADGRVINFRVANFICFRDSKIVSNLSLLDTFDAVEQVVGHRIEFSGIKNAQAGDFVAV